VPFRSHTFAAVIANHSLEHIDSLRCSLKEIGRVLIRDGCFFASVPDASTLTDKLYRWLTRGGGHVNAFTSPLELAKTIERGTGLRLVATRTLYSSLSFLNPHNSPRIYGWALYFGAIPEPVNTETTMNVCIRCGRGFPTFSLKQACLVHSTWIGVRVYRCPDCGATNPFIDWSGPA
jgi:SAM-dependent methyltransferase